jgi:hypothetical protein
VHTRTLIEIWLISLLFVCAVHSTHVDVATYLLGLRQTDAHIRSANGATPLHYAAAAGSHELCRALALLDNSDLFVEDNDGD